MDNFIAIIDLGSNSARLVIYKQDPHGLMFEFDNVKQVLRLSSHLTEAGHIDETGVNMTLRCMRHFKQLCDARQVSEILGVATAAVRMARNGSALIDRIAEETGISFRILSGEEEAYYGYLAVVNSTNITDAFTVDIGGGSTEITLIQHRACKKTISFPFGAVTLTRRFLKHTLPTPQEQRNLEDYLRKQFRQAPFLTQHPGLPLVALGGGARNVANVHQKKHHYPLSSLHQYVIEPPDVAQLYASFANTPLDKRRKIKGLSKDRADIIVATAAVFRTLLQVMGGIGLVISTKGLRDGVLFERILKEQQVTRIEHVALYSARELMKRYHINAVRAEHISSLCVALHDQFRQEKLIAPQDDNRRLLQIAGLLHEIGLSINMFETSQHTFYMLTNVMLLGLTHRERLFVAMIAAYKNDKRLQKQFVQYEDILAPEDLVRIRRLAVLLWTVRALDRSFGHDLTKIDLHKSSYGYRLSLSGAATDLWEPSAKGEIQEVLTKTFHKPFALD